MKSLFIHLSEPLSQCTPRRSAFFVLHTQIWLVHQTMSGKLGWGGLVPPPPSSKPKPQMVQKPILIGHTYIFSLWIFSFNSESCRCRWLFLLGGKQEKQWKRVWHGWRMTCSEIDDALLSEKETLYSSIHNTHPHERNHCIVTTLSTLQSLYSLHHEYYAATTQPDSNNCSILARTSFQAHYYQHLIVLLLFYNHYLPLRAYV